MNILSRDKQIEIAGNLSRLLGRRIGDRLAVDDRQQIDGVAGEAIGVAGLRPSGSALRTRSQSQLQLGN
jgi:hypothetical protein